MLLLNYTSPIKAIEYVANLVEILSDLPQDVFVENFK